MTAKWHKTFIFHRSFKVLLMSLPFTQSQTRRIPNFGVGKDANLREYVETEAVTDDVGRPDRQGQGCLVVDWLGPATVTATLMWGEAGGFFWRLPWQQAIQTEDNCSACFHRETWESRLLETCRSAVGAAVPPADARKRTRFHKGF